MGNSISRNSSITIIGAGISGLCTAYYLKQAGFTNITILEKESHPGGKLKSTSIGNSVTDAGAVMRIIPSPNIDTISRDVGYIPIKDLSRDVVFLNENGRTLINDMIDDMLSVFIKEVQHMNILLNYTYSDALNPGFADLHPDLCVSIREFCTENNLLMLMNFAIVALLGPWGYGAVDDISMATMFKYAPYMITTVKNAKEHAFVPRGGMYELIDYLADSLPFDICLSSEVTYINSESGSILLSDDTEIRSDHTVIAVPPESIKVSYYTEDDIDLLSKITHTTMNVVHMELQEPIDVMYRITPAFQQSETEQVYGIIPCKSDNPTPFIYTAMDSYNPALSDEEIGEIARSDVERYGFTVKNVISVHRWHHSPRVPIEAMKAGWYDNFDALQGKDNIYYVSEILNFGTLERCAEYAKHIVERFFT